MAVFASDICRQRTVDVWPRNKWMLALYQTVVCQYPVRFCMKLPCFCLPGCHVPNSDFAVTTTTDEDVTPRNHSPYTHHVALQRFLVISAGVIHMDLRIIHGKHNIFWRKVQCRDHAQVRRNMLRASPAFIPCRLDHIFLLEVGSVGSWSGSTFSRRNAARRGR